MSKTAWIVVAIVVAVLIIWGIVATVNPPANQETLEEESAMMEEKEGDAMMEEKEDGAMMEEKEGDAMMEEKEDGAMMEEKEGDAMMEEEHDVMEEDGNMSFEGTRLNSAGSLLLDFNKADYDLALESGKPVALYFYANWCPICRAEFPRMVSAFDQIESNDLVGFRVNFNDNQTDDNEESLARQFGVAYQHTKIFIKNGERVLKSPESWSENRYLEELNNLLQ